ncbi:hypothetical protein EMIT0347P_20424 [Pseudomonas sp. IT-347P]
MLDQPHFAFSGAVFKLISLGLKLLSVLRAQVAPRIGTTHEQKRGQQKSRKGQQKR